MPTSSALPALRVRPRARFIHAAAVTLVALGAVAGAGAAHAQADATWSQFQGDAGRTGTAPGPAPGFREAWRVDVAPAGPGGRYGLSPAVVAGDQVVAVGPDQVIGVDLATGAETFAVDRVPGPSVPAAIAQAPGAEALVVYTQGWGAGPPDPGATDAGATPTPDGDTGAAPALGTPSLAAFSLGDQAPPWDPVVLDAVSRTGVTTSDGLAFVGTNRGTVYAIDLTDGSIAWQRELDALLVTPIAVADGIVLVGLQGDRETSPVVVALDGSTGDERWRHEPDAAAVVSAIAADGDAAYAIFSGFAETRIESIATGDGALRWSRRVNGTFDVSPPVVGEDAVTVTDLVGHTRALAVADGADRWDFAQNVATFRSVPASVGGSLLVPSREGDLGAIDTSSGELVWRLEGDGDAIRAVTPAGDLLVVVRGGAGAGLQALEHDPEAALIAEASPTTPAWGPMLAAIALAVVPVLAVVLLGGRWLARRPQEPSVGTAAAHTTDQPPGDGGAEDEEPVHDPWEDDQQEPTS